MVPAHGLQSTQQNVDDSDSSGVHYKLHSVDDTSLNATNIAVFPTSEEEVPRSGHQIASGTRSNTIPETIASEALRHAAPVLPCVQTTLTPANSSISARGDGIEISSTYSMAPSREELSPRLHQDADRNAAVKTPAEKQLIVDSDFIQALDRGVTHLKTELIDHSSSKLTAAILMAEKSTYEPEPLNQAKLPGVTNIANTATQPLPTEEKVAEYAVAKEAPPQSQESSIERQADTVTGERSQNLDTVEHSQAMTHENDRRERFSEPSVPNTASDLVESIAPVNAEEKPLATPVVHERAAEAPVLPDHSSMIAPGLSKVDDITVPSAQTPSPVEDFKSFRFPAVPKDEIPQETSRYFSLEKLEASTDEMHSSLLTSLELSGSIFGGFESEAKHSTLPLNEPRADVIGGMSVPNTEISTLANREDKPIQHEEKVAQLVSHPQTSQSEGSPDKKLSPVYAGSKLDLKGVGSDNHPQHEKRDDSNSPGQLSFHHKRAILDLSPNFESPVEKAVESESSVKNVPQESSDAVAVAAPIIDQVPTAPLEVEVRRGWLRYLFVTGSNMSVCMSDRSETLHGEPVNDRPCESSECLDRASRRRSKRGRSIQWSGRCRRIKRLQERAGSVRKDCH